MVVLTLVAQKNGETIYFEEPIPKVHLMKLISCSLYNSWYTLKKEGSIAVGDVRKPKGRSVTKIFPGHYDLESLAKKIESSTSLKTETNSPHGQLQIKNTDVEHVYIDRDLASLFGSDRNLFGNSRDLAALSVVKRLLYPSTYFIHCDLIDKEQNLFNGKKSDLLARFDVTGKPFEKVTYNASQQQVLRDCSTDQHVNSITLSVKDQNGELFDFNGFDMEFELELN